MHSSFDLAESGPSPESLRCRVCIIGAGTVGSYLAHRLGQLGVDVLVLEAGRERAQSSERVGFSSRFASAHYPAATDGRAFGPGGTSALWGGVLVPHTHYDVAFDESGIWEHLVSEVTSHGGQVLKTFGYAKDPEFLTFPRDESHLHDRFTAGGLGVLSSLMLPFSKKDTFRLLEKGATKNVRVCLGAIVRECCIDESGSVRKVIATSLAGNRLEVEARQFVIAAGAIESARLLLEIGSQNHIAGRLSPDVGVGLGDHLSTTIAEFDAHEVSRVGELMGPRFQGSWMRAFRFVDRSPPSELPRHFAHVIFEDENEGFRLAKKVLTSMQRRNLPQLSLGESWRGISGVTRLAEHRFFKRRLYLSPKTKAHLQIDVEQPRSSENRISLGNERDAFGRPRAVIDWRISDQDLERMRAVQARILHLWSKVEGVPSLCVRRLDLSAQKPHDAFHPVGVTRMGKDPDAVLDCNSAVRGLRNLSIAGTSVLPTAGTANPTFSALCLANALAGRLSNESR